LRAGALLQVAPHRLQHGERDDPRRFGPQHAVQVNAIAQNFVDNPTYFPPELQANPAFQERLKRDVPLGRLVASREDALFAAYLCSAAADCFVGQVFPLCGGWVTR